MKATILFLTLTISFALNAQTTYVPDDNFEQRLIDLGYDDVLDDQVLTVNISGVTNLDLQNKSIADLTGLEAFSSLTYLNCDNNLVTSIPLHPNVNLEGLFCQNNQLTELNLSAHTNLSDLNCAHNNITELDLNNNIALSDLGVADNLLTELDVTQLVNLFEFNFQENNISEIDLIYNTSLYYLYSSSNLLTELDVSSLSSLVQLMCHDNNIATLDLSQNLNLTELGAGGNQFSELDLTHNINLQRLSIFSETPTLTKIDLRNGNNLNISFFAVLNTPNLPYIYVDDCNYSTVNWTNIDPTTIFVEMEGQTECELLEIEDLTPKSFDITAYPNPTNDILYLQSNLAEEIEKMEIVDIYGKTILTLAPGTKIIDLSELQSGLYFLNTTLDYGRVTKKIIKK